MKTILIVEDDYQIASPVKEFLERNNYKAIWSSTGFEALEDIELYKIDLVLLDLMMPDLDGYGFLDRLRRKSRIPVIIVSARTAVSDKVKGFELGADDYLTKPFSLMELITRIEYHLKKNQPKIEKNDSIYKFKSGLIYNSKTMEVKEGDYTATLTSKEADILDLFIVNKGNTLSKKDIYETIWAEEDLEGNNTITVHIKSIREKLNEDLKKPKYIETVWGKGYKFIGEIE